MARPVLGPRETSIISAGNQKEGDSILGKEHSQIKDHDQKTTGEGDGIPPIRLYNRPDFKSKTEGHGKSVAKEGKFTSQGHQKAHTSAVQETAQTMVHSKKSIKTCPPNIQTTLGDHPHGCFSQRLGGSR